MKKTLLALAALALAVSCSKEEGTTTDNGQPVELRLQAAIEASSRAGSDLQGAQFEPDKMLFGWVRDAGTNAKLYSNIVLMVGEDGSSLTPCTLEEAMSGHPTPLRMYYPQTGNDVEIISVMGLPGTVEGEHHDENGYAPNDPDYEHGETYEEFQARMGMPDGPMKFWAREDADSKENYLLNDLVYAHQTARRSQQAVALKYYHMLSKIEVNLTFEEGFDGSEMSRMRLTEVLCNCTFDPSRGTDLSLQSERAKMVKAEETAASRQSLTLYRSDWAEDYSTTTFVGIVVPQSGMGSKLVFPFYHAGQTYTYEYALPAGAKFESGKRHVYNVTFSRQGMTVTSRVAEWNDGEGDDDGSATMPDAPLGDKAAADAAVGDFYLADGTLVDSKATLTAQQAAAVVGLVFTTDPARIGAAEKDALAKLGITTPHGLVVATKALQLANDDPTAWLWYKDADGNGSRDESALIPYFFVAGDAVATFNLVDADIDGYAHNVAIRTQRATDYNNTALNDGLGAYPAFKLAENFKATVPPPSKTTGWYLPSQGQWFDVVRGICGIKLTGNAEDGFTDRGDDDGFYWNNNETIALLNAAMAKVPNAQKTLFYSSSADFLTSSVADDSNSYTIGFSSIAGVRCRIGSKILETDKVRCVLAF